MHPPRSTQLAWAECEQAWPLPLPRSGRPPTGVSAQGPGSPPMQVRQVAKGTQVPSLPLGAPSGAQVALAIFAVMTIGPSGPLKNDCAFTGTSLCPRGPQAIRGSQGVSAPNSLARGHAIRDWGPRPARWCGTVASPPPQRVLTRQPSGPTSAPSTVSFACMKDAEGCQRVQLPGDRPPHAGELQKWGRRRRHGPPTTHTTPLAPTGLCGL